MQLEAFKRMFFFDKKFGRLYNSVKIVDDENIKKFKNICVLRNQTFIFQFKM